MVTHVKLHTNTNDVELSEDSKLMKIRGFALTEGKWNNIFWPKEEIRKLEGTLAGKFLTIDHSKSIRDIVGRIDKDWFEGKGIKYEATVFDRDLIDKVKQIKQVSGSVSFGTSLELYLNQQYNRKTKQVEASNLDVRRNSIVLEPACEDCYTEPLEKRDYVENITKCEARYMNDKKNKYKKGWDGCMEAKQACHGLSKKHAEALCNYIFWRKKGHGYQEKDEPSLTKLNDKLMETYESVDNKDEYIRELEEETEELKRKYYELPFADYKDFDDCVKKNSDKEDPKAYCAEIKRQVEGKSNDEDDIVDMKDCKDQYVNPDDTFKGGFDGCVKWAKNCRGLNEKDAKQLCAYIGRKTGKMSSKDEDGVISMSEVEKEKDISLEKEEQVVQNSEESSQEEMSEKNEVQDSGEDVTKELSDKEKELERVTEELNKFRQPMIDRIAEELGCCKKDLGETPTTVLQAMEKYLDKAISEGDTGRTSGVNSKEGDEMFTVMD